MLCRLDVGLLRPGRARAREDVDRARRLRRVVGLVAVDAGRVLSSVDRADGERIAVAAQRDREAELIAIAEAVGRPGFTGVRRLDVRLLRPGCAAAREHIDRARLRNRLVVLIAVDALALLASQIRRHRHGVAVGAQRDDMAELGAGLWIRCLDVRLLRPVLAVAREHVHGAGIEERVVASDCR